MAEALTLLLFALALLAALGLQVVVLVTVVRLRPGGRRFWAHLAASAAGVVGFTVLFAGANPTSSTAYFAPCGLVIVLCAGYSLFHFDNMGETSRRIRILRELCAAGRGMTRKDLLAAYSPREVFERRLRRLRAAGQCEDLANGRLRLRGGSYTWMAWLVKLWARLVIGTDVRLR